MKKVRILFLLIVLITVLSGCSKNFKGTIKLHESSDLLSYKCVLSDGTYEDLFEYDNGNIHLFMDNSHSYFEIIGETVYEIYLVESEYIGFKDSYSLIPNTRGDCKFYLEGIIVADYIQVNKTHEFITVADVWGYKSTIIVDDEGYMTEWSVSNSEGIEIIRLFDVNNTDVEIPTYETIDKLEYIMDYYPSYTYDVVDGTSHIYYNGWDYSFELEQDLIFKKDDITVVYVSDDSQFWFEGTDINYVSGNFFDLDFGIDETFINEIASIKYYYIFFYELLENDGPYWYLNTIKEEAIAGFFLV